MAEESLLSGAAKTGDGVQQPADAVKPADVVADAGKPAAGVGDQGKADGQPPVDDKGAAKVETKEPVVPEKYEFAVPEGFELDAEIATEFEAFAKESKLTQEVAQKYVDFGAKLVQANQKKADEAWANQRKTWREEVVADKEVGGKALAENMGYAAKAIDTFGPELRELFDTSGWGDNPAFVKAFIRIGKAISEDRLVGGVQQDTGTQKTPENVLYPAM